MISAIKLSMTVMSLTYESQINTLIGTTEVSTQNVPLIGTLKVCPLDALINKESQKCTRNTGACAKIR